MTGSLKDNPEVPKITKALSIIKWTEAFTDFLDYDIGTRKNPSAYVTREDENMTSVAPALATDRPYSTEHGSVKGSLVAKASHDHSLYGDDKSKVYFYSKEVTQGTSYATCIKPSQ